MDDEIEPCPICHVAGCNPPVDHMAFAEWAGPREAPMEKPEEATIPAQRDVYREEPVAGSNRRRRVLAVRKGDLLTPSQARHYGMRAVEAPARAVEET